ncbi:MAG: DUF4430 domain-containing protein [Candidatus Liptonbacteria bacterium]|nr:DUF4430 domain-containing protein [Candidatus Liptonbacteria bacterium]
MFFKKNNKIVSVIFAIVFIAIAVLFFASYREPANTPSAAEISNQVIGTVKQSDIVSEKKLVLPSNKSSADNPAVPVLENKSGQNQNQLIQESGDNLIKITLAAGDNKYDISAQKGATVYDAMTTLASTTQFSFSSKYYSGLGYFIDSINGIKNANGNYWTLYVNGTYATVGASAYKLSGNDRIEWKYSDKANY